MSSLKDIRYVDVRKMVEKNRIIYFIIYIYFRYYFIQARESVIGTYNHIVMNLQR